MDEQAHYLGVSFPCCQVQGVAAFRVSDIGQRVVPQQNLNHIPGKQKSTMSFWNQRSSHGVLRLSLTSPPPLSSPPDLLLKPTATDVSPRAMTHLPLAFLDNPSISRYFENVWTPCLNCASLPSLWQLNSVQHLHRSSQTRQVMFLTT